ncbi:hypothetical protein ABK040_005689 [Willaertia magna]
MSVNQSEDSNRFAVALFPFDASEDNEVTIQDKEYLLLIKVADDWSLVKNQQNRMGYVPSAYIKEVEESAVDFKVRTKLKSRRNIIAQDQQQQSTSNNKNTNNKISTTLNNENNSRSTSTSTNNNNVVNGKSSSSSQLQQQDKTIGISSLSTSSTSQLEYQQKKGLDHLTNIFTQHQQSQQQPPISPRRTENVKKDYSKFVRKQSTTPNSNSNNTSPFIVGNNNTVNNNNNNNNSSSTSSTTTTVVKNVRPPQPKGYSEQHQQQQHAIENNKPKESEEKLSVNSTNSSSSSNENTPTTPSTGNIKDRIKQLQDKKVPVMGVISNSELKNARLSLNLSHKTNTELTPSNNNNTSIKSPITPSSSSANNLQVNDHYFDANNNNNVTTPEEETKNNKESSLSRISRTLSTRIKLKGIFSSGSSSSETDFPQTPKDNNNNSANNSFNNLLSPYNETTVENNNTETNNNNNTTTAPPVNLLAKELIKAQKKNVTTNNNNTIPSTTTTNNNVEDENSKKTKSDLFAKMHSQLLHPNNQQPWTVVHQTQNGVVLEEDVNTGGVELNNTSGSTTARKRIPVSMSYPQHKRNAAKIIVDKYKAKKRLNIFKNYLQKDESLKNARIRKQKVLEIISTERDYVQNLQICVNEFILPMRGNPRKYGIKENSYLNGLFLNIEQILSCNLELLNQLNEQVLDQQSGKSNCIKIGVVFKQMAAWFKLYTEYINNHEDATRLYDELMLKKKFSAFIEKQQNNTKCKNLPLAAFLIQPIQRIPRYRLLLEDVIKHTPPDHVDMPTLKDALNEILKIANWVNERKRENENRDSLVQLQLKLSEEEYKSILQPYRKFIGKTSSVKITVTYKENETDKYVVMSRACVTFLFKDLLVVLLQDNNNQTEGTTTTPATNAHILSRENILLVFLVFSRLVKVENMSISEEEEVPSLVQLNYCLKGRDLLIDLDLSECDKFFSKNLIDRIVESKRDIKCKYTIEEDKVMDYADAYNRINKSLHTVYEQMVVQKEKTISKQKDILSLSNEIERKKEEIRKLTLELEKAEQLKQQRELEQQQLEETAKQIQEECKEVKEDQKSMKDVVFNLLNCDSFSFNEVFGEDEYDPFL